MLKKANLLLRRLVVNFIILGILAAALYGITRAVDRFSDGSDFERLIPPAIMVSLEEMV